MNCVSNFQNYLEELFVKAQIAGPRPRIPDFYVSCGACECEFPARSQVLLCLY